MSEEAAPKRSARKWIAIGLKAVISAGILAYVYRNLVNQEGARDLLSHLERLHWGWFAAACGLQVVMIAFGLLRWRILLAGQGIRPRIGFLLSSFMIGRFWGAFAPGTLGLDGWRLYDVSTQTKKVARPIAVWAVEKILGQLAFGLVVMVGSIAGLQFVGIEAVIGVNAFFVVLVATGMTFLARPQIFRWTTRFLPRQVQPKLITLIDAVCAYQGKAKLLAQAVGCGVGVHALHNLIYVCAARALGADISPAIVFFGSSLQIMVTIVPISINGIGLREATAVALYTSIGVPRSIAMLIATVGFAAEMVVSAFGAIFWFARKAGYQAKIEIDDPDREDLAVKDLPEVPREKWPRPLRGLAIGAGAGLIAGAIIGIAEGSVVIADGGGRIGWGVLLYGAIAYGLLCTALGAGMVFSMAVIGRWMKREAFPEPYAYARTIAVLVAGIACGLTAFRIRRDVFHEEFAFKSKQGLLLLGASALGALVLYLLLAASLRFITARRPGRVLLRAWGSPALFAVIVAGVAAASSFMGPSAVAHDDRVHAPEGAPNVLVIVVDTMRADHLPAWGYSRGHTPSLDRFAEDSVRFDQAFSNASWTRPSFASILTGRYASSHGVMAKSDALPDAVETMPEALSHRGYATAGFVTNFNVGPYFNFQQGFDEYTFLEPEFVLGADDSAAKLLLMQFTRQQIETWRAQRGDVLPGTAYQDAEAVNRHLSTWLDHAPRSPFFLFVGYMDPHDPYFEHPYNGSGYARAAHQTPDPSEAAELTRLYDGEIRYWDQQFGLLMEDLRRRGLYDDMMIVVTADHGEELAEHGGFWHGTTLYDEQVHVPLFVKLPRNERAGTVVRHWVQSIDLMPTVLARAGVRIPAGVQGGSLDEGTTRVYAEESHEGNILHSVRELRDFRELKVITANAGNPRGLGEVEMYRVDDDPLEHDNRAEAERSEAQAMMPILEQARQNAGRGAVRANTRATTADERRHLCQIGYVDAQQCCREGYLSGPACRGS